MADSDKTTPEFLDQPPVNVGKDVADVSYQPMPRPILTAKRRKSAEKIKESVSSKTQQNDVINEQNKSSEPSNDPSLPRPILKAKRQNSAEKQKGDKNLNVEKTGDKEGKVKDKQSSKGARQLSTGDIPSHSTESGKTEGGQQKSEGKIKSKKGNKEESGNVDKPVHNNLTKKGSKNECHVDNDDRYSSGKPTTTKKQTGHAGKPDATHEKKQTGHAGKPDATHEKKQTGHASKPDATHEKKQTGHAGKPDATHEKKQTGHTGKPDATHEKKELKNKSDVNDREYSAEEWEKMLKHDLEIMIRNEQRKPQVPQTQGTVLGEVSLDDLKELEKEIIFPLKKKSLKFPRAQFFCRLCEYHCDTVADCRKHAKDGRHKRRVEIRLSEEQLNNMPHPSKRHIQAVNDAVEKVFAKFSLRAQQTDQRKQIVHVFNDWLTVAVPGLHACLYGSSASGFALQSSDVNIDLLIPAGLNPAKTLQSVFFAMRDSDKYKSLRSDFSSKVIGVHFEDEPSNLKCYLTIGGSSATLTTKLLAVYCQMDERVRKVGIAFRHFTKVCGIDNQHEGTLPAISAPLMSVFFLQHHMPPVLPVLQLSLNSNKTGEESAIMGEDLEKEAKKWKTTNKQTVGQLWLELLKFYSLKFDSMETVVSIKFEGHLSRSDKKWKGKRLAIEDPFSSKGNVARSVCNTRVFEYIHDCFLKTYLYFGLPRLRDAAFSHQHPSSKETQPDIHDDMTREKVSNPAEISQKCTESCDKHDVVIELSNSDSEVTSVINIDIPKSSNVEKLNQETTVTRNATYGFVDELVSSTVNTAVDFAEQKKHDLGNASGVNSRDALNDTNIRQGELSTINANEPSDLPVISQSNQDIIDVADNFANLVVNNVSSELETTSDSFETVAKEDICDSVICVVSDSDDTLIKPGDSEVDAICDNGSDDATRADDDDATRADDDATRADDDDDATRADDDDATRADDDDATRADDDDATRADDDATRADDDDQPVDESQQDNDERDDEDILSDTSSMYSNDVVVEESDSSGDELNYFYQFLPGTLSDGKGPAVICTICEKEGHLSHSCPEENLPELLPLKPLSKRQQKLLTEVLKNVRKDFAPTEEEVLEREYVLREIERPVRECYSDASLHLFGSSCNGFGFRDSDIDICVTFKHHAQETVDYVEIIEKLAKKLKRSRGMANVVPLTTAKVPIIKFYHPHSQLDGDISLYNTLGQHNTRLLHTYCIIDDRVQILGYCIKVFAKICMIGDASRGSLSSYGYILLLLHYLQQCRPAVIPVLQELHPPDRKPEVLVDGWNAWFFEDIDKLSQVWPDYGKNKQSVSELWIGMFRYYTETFNIRDQVVCIRQLLPLSRFEKLWNGNCIAVEDPFDLAHNLGGGLSRKMNTYIMKALINGRQLYGSPLPFNPKPNAVLGDYYFDVDQLTDGAPPTDRCCRACGKIGHIAKECPIVIARKQRDEKKRMTKQKQEEIEAQRQGSHQNRTPSQNNHQNRMPTYNNHQNRQPAHNNPQNRQPTHSNSQQTMVVQNSSQQAMVSQSQREREFELQRIKEHNRQDQGRQLDQGRRYDKGQGRQNRLPSDPSMRHDGTKPLMGPYKGVEKPYVQTNQYHPQNMYHGAGHQVSLLETSPSQRPLQHGMNVPRQYMQQMPRQNMIGHPPGHMIPPERSPYRPQRQHSHEDHPEQMPQDRQYDDRVPQDTQYRDYYQAPGRQQPYY